MKKNKTQKLYLGIFVIISTILLVVALYFIGSKQNLFGKTIKINAVFSNVNGLQPGNNVRFSGINVGTVKKIEMINDTSICVQMIIEQDALQHLKKNAVATIKTDGLVGSMTISILPTKEPSDPLVPGDTLKSIKKLSTDDMLSTLGKTNENVALLVAELLKTTNSINEGEGTVGLLLNDKTLASDLKLTVQNLQSVSIQVMHTMSEINNIVNSINYEESLIAVLLSDSSSAEEMRSIIHKLNLSSTEMNEAVENANDVIVKIKNAEGPLDYMVNDTTFENNLNQILENIKQGSVLLNEDLEALKHNFLFRRYFKKLEKE